MKLLIIQPWFNAIGHPAQSLINMASAIGRNEQVEYLISQSNNSEHGEKYTGILKSWGEVESFTVATPMGASNTVRALLALLCMRMRGRQYQRIFFFDSSLNVLALLWPLFSFLLPVERLGVLHLFAPNLRKGIRSRCGRIVIKRFLQRPEVKFYLRTDELEQAWNNAHNNVEGRMCISTLPSLEIPDGPEFRHTLETEDTVKFGVLGQIRPGKGIEWLVPAFQRNKSLGKLAIAGEFNIPETREQLSVLKDFDGFINRFMTETELLEQAAAQDYLLILYDLWDRRMESAVLYLAARVNRPVIVYGDSWCGRMVREFGCGIEAPSGHNETIELLQRIPRPGSEEYDNLLKGMGSFRQAYSVNSLRGKVMRELLD